MPKSDGDPASVQNKDQQEDQPTQNDNADEKGMDNLDGVLEEVVEDVISFAAVEEKPVYPEKSLHLSEISTNLSMLGKTADGYGYTFLKAKITGLNLTELSAITSFKHLQHLDVSNNFLTLEALQIITELPFLILIQADKNVLESAALKRMKYLQVIVMNKNFIHSLEDVYQPELSTLELGENKISKLSFKEKNTTLRCLDLRHNLIEDLSELDFINLDSLYLAGNNITALDGIERLVNLRILHVRHNPIKLLTAFTKDLTKLQYLNLRNCMVTTLLQVKKLRVLPALRTLVLKGCPYMGGLGEETKEVLEEEDDVETRTEVLAALPKLTRLNKNQVTPEERTTANELMMTWIEEGEKDEEEVTEEMQGETDVAED